MFEAAELGRKVSKVAFAAAVPKLRSELLQAHFALKDAKVPVIVIVSGVDGAGKGEVVHRLNEWLDPRGVETHAFWRLSDEESERPAYWRFWRALPARGRIGIFFGSWYSEPIVRRVYGKIKSSELDGALDRIALFEKMLVEDGALIVKLWYHLSRKEQRKRLEALEADPKTRSRVRPLDWQHFKLYDRFIKVTERVIRRTDTGYAPWRLIESGSRRYRELITGRLLLEAIQQRLNAGQAAKAAAAARPPATSVPGAAGPTILDRVDLTQALSDKEYREQLEKYQGRLSRLTWAAFEKQRSCVAVFEGWDAAGKGSAIRRVTQAVDPRLYRTVSIAAPTDEERSHHYLWRFWRHLPRAGMITIYDRSWYGRVLVERVERFAREDEWMRAYKEINEFEEELTAGGIVLGKFWLHIGKDEQIRRFKERQKVSFKQYKITDEDWRNRKQWDAYTAAVNDMVTHTSTAPGPWTLVAGNDKKFARVQILKTLCARLERAL